MWFVVEAHSWKLGRAGTTVGMMGLSASRKASGWEATPGDTETPCLPDFTSWLYLHAARSKGLFLLCTCLMPVLRFGNYMSSNRGEVVYTAATGKWRRQDAVRILSVLDTHLAAFPIIFLETCGDNTWSYIRYVIGLLVEEDAEHPGAIFAEQGEPVVPSDAPIAGDYRFIEAREFLPRMSVPHLILQERAMRWY